MKLRGLFIILEGTEGAGKSTLLEALSSRLTEEQKSHILTREPGGSPLAEKIRRVILEESMNPWTELFLYEAARAQHLHETILPALHSGKIVLCDRFTDSSLAYQAHARGLSWKKVHQVNEIAIQGLKADLKVLLDIDPERGLQRANDRNRFEAEGLAFQKKVREGYLKAIREKPKNWLRLKVSKHSPEKLADKILEEIKERHSGRYSKIGKA